MEAEAFLSGQWKNFIELEETLSLPELDAVVKASRDKERRLMKFYAAFKGVNLDEQEGAAERFEEIQRRAEARLAGKSPEEVDEASEPSFEELGIEFEEVT